jgi:peptidylprolyl isomerase
MAQATAGDTVKVDYTGRFEDGTVFDSSENREPLEFTIGEGQVIPGFEQGVEGMSPGEEKTITISADDAYGPHHEELVMVVDRGEFPPDMELSVGDVLQLRQPDGGVALARVTDLDDSNATIDANHPLAGKDLIFDVKLDSIESKIIIASS